VSQNTPLLIKGGTLVDPLQGRNSICDLLIDDERVKWIWESGKGETPPLPDGIDSFDATGMIVSPGFIDLHCHLREPGEPHKETFQSGTAAAAAGGFTTVCVMPNTIPSTDTAQAVLDILELSMNSALIRVLPIGALSINRDGMDLTDMLAMKEAGVVGFSDDGAALADPDLMYEALKRSRDLHIPVIQHSEDPSIVQNGLMHEGWISKQLGIPGSPAVSESSLVARDIEITERTEGILHIAHVSSLLTLEHLERAKNRGIKISAEVTPHHLVFTHDSLLGQRGFNFGWPDIDKRSSLFRVNPPLRDKMDTEALIDALKSGLIDIVATDHAPHALEDKKGRFDNAIPGISGIETAFSLLFTAIVETGKMNIGELIEKFTVKPASLLPDKYLKDGLGTLVKGGVADIVIIDPSTEWVVKSEKFVSKGRNTPLDGCNLKGKIIATIHKGDFVFDITDEAPMGKGE
jgi:dihydroorotase